MDNLTLNIQKAFQKLQMLMPLTSVPQHSVEDLVVTTKLSACEVKLLQKAIRENVLKLNFVSSYDLYINRQKLSFGCRILDEYLNGGIKPQSITEIYGKSATGKSQICLQLSMMVQLPESHGGLNGSAVYITTENKFPDKRFEQMKPFFKQKYKDVFTDSEIGDKIFVKHVVDVKELSDILERQLPKLIKASNVKLLVIDSIAAIFRVEYTMEEMDKRAKVLNKIAAKLLQLSVENHVTILCVNQVIVFTLHLQ